MGDIRKIITCKTFVVSERKGKGDGTGGNYLVWEEEGMWGNISSKKEKEENKKACVVKKRENGEIKGETCLIIGGEEENREGKGGRYLA